MDLATPTIRFPVIKQKLFFTLLHSSSVREATEGWRRPDLLRGCRYPVGATGGGSRGLGGRQQKQQQRRGSPSRPSGHPSTTSSSSAASSSSAMLARTPQQGEQEEGFPGEEIKSSMRRSLFFQPPLVFRSTGPTSSTRSPPATTPCSSSAPTSWHVWRGSPSTSSSPARGRRRGWRRGTRTGRMRRKMGCSQS